MVRFWSRSNIFLNFFFLQGRVVTPDNQLYSGLSTRLIVLGFGCWMYSGVQSTSNIGIKNLNKRLGFTNRCSVLLRLCLYFILLNSKRSEGASGFTMVFIFFFYIYPVFKISTGWSASISTYSTLSCSKLDQDGTLERSFFDFLNSYLIRKTTDKLRKTS